MTVFLIAFIVFATAIAGMAVGVILSNRRLRGTCGGLSGMTDENGEISCQICSTPSTSCQGDPHQPDNQESEHNRAQSA